MTKLRDVSLVSVPFENGNKEIAYGHIIIDDKNRFLPGDYIRTSVVTNRGEDFIQTLNTRYEVENWINNDPND